MKREGGSARKAETEGVRAYRCAADTSAAARERRQTRDLSLTSVALAAAGTLLWAAYGTAIGSGPVTVSNIVVMPFAMATFAMKLRRG